MDVSCVAGRSDSGSNGRNPPVDGCGTYCFTSLRNPRGEYPLRPLAICLHIVKRRYILGHPL
ncbi:hypothetical protein NJ7G_1807 [Natrinema sp. J7-2]|nr:hypothetical protein NJ7G_1807 [Natrinema sp. J7-2]